MGITLTSIHITALFIPEYSYQNTNTRILMPEYSCKNNHARILMPEYSC
jgi:hypothetical protein